MTDPRIQTFDWVLWLKWVVANTLAWVLAAALLGDLAMAAGGLVIGSLQWVILRKRLPQAGWWVVASAAGWAMGWAIVIALVPPEFGVLTGTALGAALGTTQWLFLRRHFHRAGWWLVVSPLGWTAGMTLLTGPLLVGAVAGAVTGIALELLLRYPALMKDIGHNSLISDITLFMSFR
jgi:hypothetical protein